MTGKPLEEFKANRERLNKLVMRYAGTNMKRLFHVDAMAYEDGALPKATKELLGLVASTVLRCDDCISYHVDKCHEEGVSSEEFEEAMTIALTVGGSVTIPHLRRAFENWDSLQSQNNLS